MLPPAGGIAGAIAPVESQPAAVRKQPVKVSIVVKVTMFGQWGVRRVLRHNGQIGRHDQLRQAACAVPNIKVAIALAGATFNPLTGFLYPVFFSLKLDPAPLFSRKKLFCLFMFFFFTISSILGLY